MAGVIPDIESARVLSNYVRNDMSLRLYSNDLTPDGDSVLANFTQVAGGGYAALTIDNASWTVTPGDPSVADSAVVSFNFTGTTNTPGTVYGYYLVDIVTGLLIGSQRLEDAILPFVPVNGSVINITPHVEAT